MPPPAARRRCGAAPVAESARVVNKPAGLDARPRVPLLCARWEGAGVGGAGGEAGAGRGAGGRRKQSPFAETGMLSQSKDPLQLEGVTSLCRFHVNRSRVRGREAGASVAPGRDAHSSRSVSEVPREDSASLGRFLSSLPSRPLPPRHATPRPAPRQPLR